MQKVWYSTSANPPEFQGNRKRLRKREAIAGWPSNSSTAVTFTIALEETTTVPKIIPVMPHKSIDGEDKLMSMDFGYPTVLDSSVTKPLKEFSVKSLLEDNKVAEIKEDPTATTAPKIIAWNDNLVCANSDSNEGQSLYRTIHKHDFNEVNHCSPRGLFNTNNMCFYNSVLQVLVHCTRLNSLISDIVLHTPLTNEPILSAIAKFFYSYATFGNIKRAMSGDELYNVICNQPSFFHVERGRQEDAQEFLTDLLDVIEKCFKHAEPTKEDIADNILAHKRAAAQPLDNDGIVDDNEDSGWVEIGHNNKVVETQHAGHQDLDNPVEELFSGRFRSILVKKGGKPSITIEPFQQIPVDISGLHINTLQQALDEMFQVEFLNLDGGQATKRLEIERLPPVLIVNLKRFTFFRQGESFDYGKITKPVLINDKIVFTLVGNRTLQYSPFGVIYHHGMDISRGHYTADVKVQGQWYSIDDEQVVPVESEHVVGDGSNRGSQAAYMVFYSRV